MLSFHKLLILRYSKTSCCILNIYTVCMTAGRIYKNVFKIPIEIIVFLLIAFQMMHDPCPFLALLRLG